jgi:hypothetical protein
MYVALARLIYYVQQYTKPEATVKKQEARTFFHFPEVVTFQPSKKLLSSRRPTTPDRAFNHVVRPLTDELSF